MSELIPAAGRPPLAYSLPAFSHDGYRSAPLWLERLRSLGFEWVTFHPTFAVHHESPLRIEHGPDLAEPLQWARSLGFHVRLEPHLDWATTLNGGPYQWRRRMYLDPMRDYFDRVLQPLAALGPDELTLGSELDVSAYEFAAAWAEAAERLSPSGVSLGHKLNHDWRTARASIRRELNLERAGRGLSPRWLLGFGRPLHAYLASLDYVAISFYPPGDWELAPQFTIGEFGLGSTRLDHPWLCDAQSFHAPGAREIRRGYYLRFLNWIASRTGRAACFWTAGHFDILGIMHPDWRDEVLIEAVREYNAAVSA